MQLRNLPKLEVVESRFASSLPSIKASVITIPFFTSPFRGLV